jgi:hypothetical protein
MTTTGDAIFLIQLIQHAAGLLVKLRSRDAEVLTPEERASLGIPDDAARERLVAAIDAAKARESDGGG